MIDGCAFLEEFTLRCKVDYLVGVAFCLVLGCVEFWGVAAFVIYLCCIYILDMMFGVFVAGACRGFSCQLLFGFNAFNSTLFNGVVCVLRCGFCGF